MDDNIGLGEKLKALRTYYRMTQKDVAEHMGISQQTVASWESGRTEPNVAAIKTMIEYFNISANYLFGDESGLEDTAHPPQFFVIQRNIRQMSKAQLDKMYNLLKLAFDELDWGVKGKK